jgi:hypothetical protein
MQKVVTNGGDDCWIWEGAKTTAGYGNLRVEGKVRYTHRLAYEEFVGPIPDGLHLDHLCRNVSCCNPDHLDPVSSGENLHRGKLGALKETCAKGHPWIPENWASNGTRGLKCCAVCKRLRERERQRRRRQK